MSPKEDFVVTDDVARIDVEGHAGFNMKSFYWLTKIRVGSVYLTGHAKCFNWSRTCSATATECIASPCFAPGRIVKPECLYSAEIFWASRGEYRGEILESQNK